MEYINTPHVPITREITILPSQLTSQQMSCSGCPPGDGRMHHLSIDRTQGTRMANEPASAMDTRLQAKHMLHTITTWCWR